MSMQVQYTLGGRCVVMKTIPRTEFNSMVIEIERLRYTLAQRENEIRVLREGRMLPARRILDEVAKDHGVPVEEWFRNKQRSLAFVRARQDAMARFRKQLGWSYPKISSYFGVRCHTTVMHATSPHVRRARRKRGSA